MRTFNHARYVTNVIARTMSVITDSLMVPRFILWLKHVVRTEPASSLDTVGFEHRLKTIHYFISCQKCGQGAVLQSSE